MSKLIGKDLKLILDGYDISGDENALTLDEMADELDSTAFGDSAHNFTLGLYQATTGINGYFNPATNRNHDRLKSLLGSNTGGVFSAFMGQGASPAIGDPAWGIIYVESKYSVNGSPPAMIATQAMLAGRGSARVANWGAVLKNGIATTNTSSTNAAVNNTAASANGGSGMLHVLGAMTTGTAVIVIEHSTDDITYVTLVTFTVDGSAIAGEVQNVAAGAAVRQYVRARHTLSTTATITYAAMFWRN